MKVRKTPQGTILEVYVKPNSREFRIESEEDGLVVSCREPAVKGRVNRELINELSRCFKRRIRILTGSSSRQKKILISSISTEEVKEILSASEP